MDLRLQIKGTGLNICSVINENNNNKGNIQPSSRVDVTGPELLAHWGCIRAAPFPDRIMRCGLRTRESPERQSLGCIRVSRLLTTDDAVFGESRLTMKTTVEISKMSIYMTPKFRQAYLPDCKYRD